MRDPWKYIAFPVAAIAGYVISLGIESIALGARLGIPNMAADLIVIAIAGLVAGFIVDDLIPAYVEKVRGSDGSGDLGGDFGGDDFDFGE